jgi:hypothetical protein
MLFLPLRPFPQLSEFGFTWAQNLDFYLKTSRRVVVVDFKKRPVQPRVHGIAVDVFAQVGFG